ncbi:putative inactive peptidyl-prolyl cis-trans isomerase-like 6 [Nowakowskiella sp. JEL0407]|nr:putative inactive peptidyl-prolyl cis-trans isomerase-like 6 [Nowakowskiella sp. JEL0407]
MTPIITEEIPLNVPPLQVSLDSKTFMQKKKETQIPAKNQTSFCLWVIGIIKSAEFQKSRTMLEILAHTYPENIHVNITPMNEFEYQEYKNSIKKFHMISKEYANVIIFKTSISIPKKPLKKETTTEAAAQFASEYYSYVTVNGTKDLSKISKINTTKTGLECGNGESKLNLDSLKKILSENGYKVVNNEEDFRDLGEKMFEKYLRDLKRTVVGMQIKTGSNEPERILIELFDDICPKTVQQFLLFAQGTNIKNEFVSYQNTQFTRILPGGWIQGGEIKLSSGEFVREPRLADENFIVSHGHRGIISMVNNGPHSNVSAFMFLLGETNNTISLADNAPRKNFYQGKYVAFGKIIDGESVLSQIERVETKFEQPVESVVIQKIDVLFQPVKP